MTQKIYSINYYIQQRYMEKMPGRWNALKMYNFFSFFYIGYISKICFAEIFTYNLHYRSRVSNWLEPAEHMWMLPGFGLLLQSVLLSSCAVNVVQGLCAARSRAFCRCICCNKAREDNEFKRMQNVMKEHKSRKCWDREESVNK